MATLADPDWEIELAETTRQVIRHWQYGRRRGICRVSTRNPVHGVIERGRIEHRRGEWISIDVDHYWVYRGRGDYLDAETALLGATTWADDTTLGREGGGVVTGRAAGLVPRLR